MQWGHRAGRHNNSRRVRSEARKCERVVFSEPHSGQRMRSSENQAKGFACKLVPWGTQYPTDGFEVQKKN
jgi:hypothetical protein